MSLELKKLCPICKQPMNYTSDVCEECKAKGLTSRTKRDIDYKRNRKDKKEQSIYTNPAWINLKIVKHNESKGLCELCLFEAGINVPAFVDDVHHIIPVKDDITKAFKKDNLICLCRRHHRIIHEELKRGYNRFLDVNSKYYIDNLRTILSTSELIKLIYKGG